MTTCEKPTRKHPNGRTGTEAGYQAHRAANEEPCPACVQAVRDAARIKKHGTADPRPIGRPPVSPEQRREKQRLNAAKWRAANPERAREIGRKSEAKRDPVRQRDGARRRYHERSALIRAEKDKPCADCGVRYPYYVMHFDHLGAEPKLFNLGRAGARAWASIQAEIAKCDVVCANCHAERTFRRLQRESVNGQDIRIGR